MRRVKLWLIEQLFPYWLWWERRKIRNTHPNQEAEEAAHYMGRQGSRYISGKPVKARRGKAARSRNNG